MLRKCGLFNKLMREDVTDKGRLRKRREEEEVVRHTMRNLERRLECIVGGMRQERKRVLGVSKIMRGDLKRYFAGKGTVE